MKKTTQASKKFSVLLNFSDYKSIILSITLNKIYQYVSKELSKSLQSNYF